MKRKFVFLISFVFACGAIYFSLSYEKKPQEKSKETKSAFLEVPPKEIGKEGSAHKHVNLYVFINGERMNFFEEKYMLRSALVHFENNDGTTVHKHTTNVTLPYFLNTLGMILTKDCLVLDTGNRYCEDGENKLSFLVNGERGDPFLYDMRDGDRVLINYGNEDEIEIRLRANAVPPVPKEILEGSY